MGTIINLAIAIAIGVYLVRWGRRQRTSASEASPTQRRQIRIVNAGLVGVTIGILFVFTWIISEGYGPRWIHTWSLPLAIAAIVGGYLLSFLSTWLAGRQ